eukprot:357243-Chlamydomonas_euryale.AAC.3
MDVDTGFDFPPRDVEYVDEPAGLGAAWATGLSLAVFLPEDGVHHGPAQARQAGGSKQHAAEHMHVCRRWRMHTP